MRFFKGSSEQKSQGEESFMLLGGKRIGHIPYSTGKEIRDEFSRGRIFCGAGRINRKKR